MLWSVTKPQPSQLRPSLVQTILFVHLAAFDLLVTFVVIPLDAIWEIIVQWLAGDITCGTLMFLKLMAILCGSFPACGHWAPLPGSSSPPGWIPVNCKETSEGSLWTVFCLPCPR